MMGMCSLPLKSVLQADSLFFDSILEVKDRSQASKQDTDFLLVGHIKVRINHMK